MKVTVVIPTYNEKENISPLIEAVFNQVRKVPSHSLQVVIADRFSPDGTGEIVKNLQNKFPHLYLIQDERKGIGIGFLTGMTYAFEKIRSDALISMDADFSHSPDDVPRLVREYEKGAKLVIGSRYIKGGGTKNWGFIRKIGSWLVNHYIRIMLGLKPKEITTNFRLFTRDVWEKLDKEKVPWGSKTFLATPALLYYLLLVQPEFVEIPITFVDRERGYSKAKLLSFALEIFHFSMRVRKEVIYTFFRFVSVGAFGIIVNLGSLFLLVEKVGLVKEVSSPLAVEASILSNFVLNNFWTFRKREVKSSILPLLLKYNIISLLGLVITFSVFLFLTKVVGFHYLLAQFFGIMLATSWTFIASMKWAWKASSAGKRT